MSACASSDSQLMEQPMESAGGEPSQPGTPERLKTSPAGSGGEVVEHRQTSSEAEQDREPTDGGNCSDQENQDPLQTSKSAPSAAKRGARKTTAQLEEEHIEREARYRRLMKLLNASQFYVNFIVDKIESNNTDLKNKIEARKNASQKASHSKQGAAAENCQSSRNSTRQLTTKVVSKKRKCASANGSRHKRTCTRDDEAASSSRTDSQESGCSDQLLATESAETSSHTEFSAEPSSSAAVSEPAPNAEENSDQPRLLTGAVLRDYQLEGFHWLRTMFSNGVNCILGDEMGLGKTIQTIALIAYLIEQGVVGPFLISAPLSTLPNWMSEFERFTPDIPVLLYHGTDRKQVLPKIARFTRVAGCRIPVHPVIVTSYDITMRDAKELSRHEYRLLVVDEGHRLKNHECQLVRALQRYRTVNRLLLTGTPLQNSLHELWSLLNFLLPEIFDDLAVFESWFDPTEMESYEHDDRIVAMERDKQVVTTMHRILTPFLLRRIKSDVELGIPPKRELLVYCPLTEEQASLYQATVDMTIARLMGKECVGDNDRFAPTVERDAHGRPKRSCKGNADFSFLFETDMETLAEEAAWEQGLARLENTRTPVGTGRPPPPKNSKVHLPLRNKMMTLRHVVNHPFLINHPIDPVTKEYLLVPDVAQKSGKMMVLDAMVDRLRAGGHKILIFSQFTMMMDVIGDMLQLRGHQYVRLDGGCSVDDRRESIARFASDPELGVFVISTRAGGLGINLSVADTVIIYDSDWNPQRDLQAQDRAHRIGQTRPVVVYRLVTGGTIDEAIVVRAAAKRKLERMMMHKSKFKSVSRQQVGTSLAAVSPEELLQLLRRREHQRVVRAAGQAFTDDELRALLDRSDIEQAWQQQGAVKAPATAARTSHRHFKVMDTSDIAL